MLLGLILAAQSILPALLAEADSRNEAFVACLFSTSRDARSNDLSAQQFEQKLSSACPAEEEELRSVSVRVLQLRGHSAADAADQTAKLLSDARRSVVTAYRQPF